MTAIYYMGKGGGMLSAHGYLLCLMRNTSTNDSKTIEGVKNFLNFFLENNVISLCSSVCDFWTPPSAPHSNYVREL